MRYALVKFWMTTDPVTVSTTTTLPEAHALMKGKNIRRLPVVNKSGVVVGIVTLGDIREAKASSATSLSIWELNTLLNELKVKRFMTPNPVVVDSSTTIGEAAQVMIANKVSGLPVVDDGKLVGIITESDIFTMVVLNEWAAEEKDALKTL